MSKKLQVTADDDNDDDEQPAIAASTAKASAAATATTACRSATHGDARVPRLGDVDVAPGCQDAATDFLMRSTPHKNEMKAGRPLDAQFPVATRAPNKALDGTGSLELLAAPGGLYRTTIASPFELGPRGFENPSVSAK